ncbi:hypothetical protein L103DPR2_01441 [Limnohabitans sp. 103DPR2]|nr:hypothetical protein L103DPR2_01441 [Limnohabitans sp. 103DPR2]
MGLGQQAQQTGFTASFIASHCIQARGNAQSLELGNNMG